MEKSSIVHQYYDAFFNKHGQTALPSHLKTLNSIRRCRTPSSGELYVKCPDCDFAEWRPLSCGNRNCPKCQNHLASQWIEKQQVKLLPYELRSFAWRNQKLAYALLFTCVSSILKDFGKRSKNLGADMGMTMVLHTNNRRLDFHPHIHAVVPGGGMDKRSCQWKQVKGDYLFHHKALAKVFRARFLAALKETGSHIPKKLPAKWVVDCSSVGKGIIALKYLSQYLYRGVISEKNIISNKNGFITFGYTESGTKKTKYRTLEGEDFLQLIMQHVLPRGFRRVRDYGFLHGNAKRLRSLIQLILRVRIPPIIPTPRPAFKCSCYQAAMIVMAFRRNGGKPG